MLSYQHIYHAGGNADCHKHSLLAALLTILRKDKTPYLYIDTHSGRGLYDLRAPETLKLKEYANGIRTLWAVPSWPREAVPYRAVIDSLNRDGKGLRHYPGSPWIAEALRRPHDHILLYELHPREYKALAANMRPLKEVTLWHEDGWTLRADDAPAYSRGLILIDPSYELKDEYVEMAERINHIGQEYPGFIIALWYPILSSERHHAMIGDLEKMSLPFVKSEIGFNTGDTGMTGSGLFVLHPPPGFDAAEKSIASWLKTVL